MEAQRAVGGAKPSRDAQKASAAVDAGHVIARARQATSNVTGATANVEHTESALVRGGRKFERLYKIAPDLRFRPGREFTRVIAGANLKENLLKRIAEQFFEWHRRDSVMPPDRLGVTPGGARQGLAKGR
jgi:hypothetical protein